MTPDALMIRTTDKAGRSHGGFEWPREIGAIVECPDWEPEACCGNGLHGLLDGIGDWSLTLDSPDALWWVIGVCRAEVVAIDDDKVKVPRGRVEFVGDFPGAMKRIMAAQADRIAELAKDNTATGDRGHAAATGYRGHAAATGYSGHAAATGDRGHAAATGDSGHAAATGYRGHAAATGYSGHAAATGYRGHAAATGYRGHAAATGYSGHAAATGDRGHAAATGDSGHAAATGDSGHAAATGDSGHASVSGKNAVAAGLGCDATAKAEAGGAIMLAAYDDDFNLVAVRASLVGANGVEAGKTYRLTVAGEFEEVA